MMIRRLALGALVAAGVLSATPGVAQTATPITGDVLRDPTRAAGLVAARQQDAYRNVMAAYTHEETAHPDDAALTMARCRFIEGFAEGDDEGLPWGEAAQADYQACQKDLEARFHGDAETSLYIAEHRYGKDGIAYAHSLLTASDKWSPIQRSRLHAVFARGYTAMKQSRLAGEEALASVQLDPTSNELVPALRYLCEQNRRQEAEALLAKSPTPAHSWAEVQRVRFALDNLSAPAALAELQRAEAIKAPIDPWLSAHIYQRAGMNAKAAELLAKAKTKPEYQSVEQFQLRVNVFTGQGDTKAASAALHDWFGKTGTTMPLLMAYGATLARAPGQFFAPALAPLALASLAMLALLACMPGLIAFPSHYRGTVRTRLGKPTEPLFTPIGLRHMWLGLGTFLVISALVPLLGTSAALQALAGQRPVSTADETIAVIAQVVMVVLGSLCLLPGIGRLSWRDWVGHRGLKVTLLTVVLWASVKALLLWAASHAPHASGLLRGTPHDRTVSGLATAATHIGGIGLALLIVAVLVPIYEELVFRGCMLGGLTRHISFGWSNFWQALVFALLHFDPSHFVFYLLLGLMAGWLVRRTRGLAASMALHAANNAVACIAMLVWV